MKVREVLLRDAHRCGFIGDDDVDHTVATLNRCRADFIRMKHTQSAPLDHRGPTHAERGLLGGNDYIAATRDHRVTGKASSGHHAHQWNQSAQLCQQRERFDVQPAGHDRIGIAGASATAFGEYD